MLNHVSDLPLPSNSQMMNYTISPPHQVIPQRSNYSSSNTSALPSTENENEDCDDCSVSTYRKYDVSLPFATGLPEHVTFTCTICLENFNSKQSLQRHIKYSRCFF